MQNIIILSYYFYVFSVLCEGESPADKLVDNILSKLFTCYGIQSYTVPFCILDTTGNMNSIGQLLEAGNVFTFIVLIICCNAQLS